MASPADEVIEALRAPDAIGSDDLRGLADWLAEDVSQQLYAIRQDLAEIDPEHRRAVEHERTRAGGPATDEDPSTGPGPTG